jgi:hypothetical protein
MLVELTPGLGRVLFTRPATLFSGINGRLLYVYCGGGVAAIAA